MLALRPRLLPDPRFGDADRTRSYSYSYVPPGSGWIRICDRPGAPGTPAVNAIAAERHPNPTRVMTVSPGGHPDRFTPQFLNILSRDWEHEQQRQQQQVNQWKYGMATRWFYHLQVPLYPTAARLSIIDNEHLGRSLMMICFERKYC